MSLVFFLLLLSCVSLLALTLVFYYESGRYQKILETSLLQWEQEAQAYKNRIKELEEKFDSYI